MVIGNRRGFLRSLVGAVAAPAIIGIEGKMRFFMPPKPGFTVANHMTTTTPFIDRGFNIDSFRAMVEPTLREHFDRIYDLIDREGLAEDLDA